MVEWLRHPDAKALMRGDDDDPYNVAPLKAGRDLDALVAEKVMGYEWWISETTGKRAIFPAGSIPHWFTKRATGSEALCCGYDNCPHCSTEIHAAWLVVEAMARKGWKIDVQNRASGWACHVNFPLPDNRHVFEHADTAPYAICLASLKAALAAPRASGSSDRE